jgi:DNA-binding transcriptional LysR family regulator
LNPERGVSKGPRQASSVIPRLDEVAAQLRAGYRRASLRVSVQPFFVGKMSVPKLSELTSANRAIDIQADTSDELADRKPPDADVSIRLLRKPPENLYSKLLINSMIAVARAAERGIAAALVPVPPANDWFRTGKLVKLFDHEVVTREGYYFVCDSEFRERVDVQAVHDWAVTTLALER